MQVNRPGRSGSAECAPPGVASGIKLNPRPVISRSSKAASLTLRIRSHRNEFAHALPEFIGKRNREIDVSLIGQLYKLIAKIDRWWIRQVEIPTNPDFDDQGVDAIPDEKIQSGRMFFLATLVRVAAGDRDEALQTCEQFFAAVEKRRMTVDQN